MKRGSKQDVEHAPVHRTNPHSHTTTGTSAKANPERKRLPIQGHPSYKERTEICDQLLGVDWNLLSGVSWRNEQLFLLS